MATKLKNLRMTSVDLVRSGANQAADICLFKSADPAEDPTQPTTEEKNIFKRFINWLFETHAEELEDPIEKADEEPYLVDIYKSAITESLQSIVADETLSETEKNDLIAKSLDEYHEAMLDLFGFGPEEEPLQKAAEEDEEIDWGEDEEVEKANPNHDALGRFASGGGGGASPNGAKNPRDMKYMLRPKNGKGANWYTDEKVAGKKYVKAYAADGFETLVDLGNHDVVVNKSADIDEIEEV